MHEGHRAHCGNLRWVAGDTASDPLHCPPHVQAHRTVLRVLTGAHITLSPPAHLCMFFHNAWPVHAGTLICIAADAGDSARVLAAWSWLRASGLEVHVACANAFLQALLREVGHSPAVVALIADVGGGTMDAAAGGGGSGDLGCDLSRVSGVLPAYSCRRCCLREVGWLGVSGGRAALSTACIPLYEALTTSPCVHMLTPPHI